MEAWNYDTIIGNGSTSGFGPIVEKWTVLLKSVCEWIPEVSRENHAADEVFIKIDGRQRYRWRAVDHDGEIVDVFLQNRRDAKAAKRFFKRMLKKHKGEPRKIVTDKLRSYGVAHRELIPGSIHDTSKYANNRADLSHPPTRVRERGMRKFKSVKQAQRFLNILAAVYNLFKLGRHLVSAETYR